MPPKAVGAAKGDENTACVGAVAASKSYASRAAARNMRWVRARHPGGTILVRGQVGRTLEALVAAGHRGTTALECSAWAFRLAAYVHDLRRAHGLAIDMEKEKPEGGWHGRYILRSPVTLMRAGI